MKKPITMYEIAAELGLSQTTVSMCLAGRAEKYRISQETVRRVQDYADKVGFVPNTIARNLTMQHRNGGKVALLMIQGGGSEKNIHALNLAKRLLEEVGREYVLQDCFPKTFISSIRSLKGEGVKEVVLFGRFCPVDGWGIWEQYDAESCRILFQNLNVYAVDDAFLGDSPVNDQIYRLGVDRIQMLFDLFGEVERQVDGPAGIYLLDSWGKKAALALFARHGIELDPAQFFSYGEQEIENSFEKGKSLVGSVRALLGRFPVKFVFVGDDRAATGLIEGLLKDGVEVPADVSVIGFDNIDACPYFKVPLSSVAIPIEEHARMVFSKILEGKDLPRIVQSKAKIIWRASAKRF